MLCALLFYTGGNRLRVRNSMMGCVEILREFSIINQEKYDDLNRRVLVGDLKAYSEISELLEEVANSAKELSEGA